MKVARYQLAQVLAEKSLGSVNEQAFANEIAAYLLDENRTGDLDSLLRDIWQYRTDNGIVEVVVQTAHELTPAVRKDIESEVRRAYPTAKKIIVTEHIDANVVGGVRLEFANEQLDLSVRAKLNRFKQLTLAGKEV